MLITNAKVFYICLACDHKQAVYYPNVNMWLEFINRTRVLNDDDECAHCRHKTLKIVRLILETANMNDFEEFS